MASFSNFSLTILILVVSVCVSTLAFPALSDISSNSDTSMDAYILSALKHRNKREVLLPTPPPPEIAAHYGLRIPRTYVYPIIVPTYYRPRIFLGIPGDYYSHYPNSDLFRLSASANNYINNLLPIFNKQTPIAKTDPVPDTLPVIPTASSDGSGVPVEEFPFWNQQASVWVWPDGVNSGILQAAEVKTEAHSKSQTSATGIDLPPLPSKTNQKAL